MNDDRPDVGRQVEVVVGLELAVPAVVAREVDGRDPGRIVGAQPRRTSGDGRGVGIAAVRSVSLGRRRFETSRPAGRAGAMVAADGRPAGHRRRAGSSARRRSSVAAAGTLPMRPRPGPGRRTARSAVWATSVAASSVDLVGLRRRGGVAEVDRVAGRALRRDREVGMDRRADPADVAPCRSSRRSGRRPGRRCRRRPCWPGTARRAPRLLRIVRARRRRSVTSTVVSVARAAASHSPRKRSRIRS